MNPRASFPTYTLSRGASSASWVCLRRLLVYNSIYIFSLQYLFWIFLSLKYKWLYFYSIISLFFIKKLFLHFLSNFNNKSIFYFNIYIILPNYNIQIHYQWYLDLFKLPTSSLITSLIYSIVLSIFSF